MIVVDASVAVKWFVAEERHEIAREILHRLDPLIGPDFLIYETLNVLRRKQKRGEVDERQLEEAAGELFGFIDRLVPATTLIDRAVALALRLDHSVYDCAYLACAIEHEAILVTADHRFVRKASAGGLAASILSL